MYTNIPLKITYKMQQLRMNQNYPIFNINIDISISDYKSLYSFSHIQCVSFYKFLKHAEVNY